jgi:RNA polymerase sigma-70 factor, ECF subfamily
MRNGSPVRPAGRDGRYSRPCRRTLADVADADMELLQRLLAADETAFAQLVDRYHTRLVRFAVAFVGDWSAAEDVAQDTWVAVLRGVERFEGRSSLGTWLFGICANRARSAYGRQARSIPVEPGGPTVHPARFGPQSAWVDPPDPWDDVDARIDAGALLPLVRTAIDALPDLQRQVVTLRDVEGLSGKDVCTVLEISEANQRVLLHRGRARVRHALEQEITEPGR